MLLVFFALLLSSLPSISLAECPDYDISTGSSSGCIAVTNYDEFKGAIKKGLKEGDKRLVFCPFSIEKTEDDSPLLVYGEIQLVCRYRNFCYISGGGTHMILYGSKTKATVQGMVFRQSTESAIRVWSNTPLEQNICHCQFSENESYQNGAAIRTEVDSKLCIEETRFRSNKAYFSGGAIFNKGVITLTDDVFEENEAKEGGAITNEGGILTVKDCVFTNNKASVKRPAIHIKPSISNLHPWTEELSKKMVLDGNNSAWGNEVWSDAKLEGTCDGSFDDVTSVCTKFNSSAGPLGTSPSPGLVGSFASANSPPSGSSTTLLEAEKLVETADKPTDAPTKVPVTSPPTRLPTSLPTRSPTNSLVSKPYVWSAINPPVSSSVKEPTKIDTIPKIYPPLSFRGFKVGDGLLQNCEGDCNKDIDCGAGLKCYRRNDFGGLLKSVPGCTNNGDHPMRRIDYCYDPNVLLGNLQVEESVGILTPSTPMVPTNAPASPQVPTFNLSKAPVLQAPSDSPTTLRPTLAPQSSSPTTLKPTRMPMEWIPDSEEPASPSPGFFNYNPTGNYGPKNWGKIKATQTSEYEYWKEFEDLINPPLDQNYCTSATGNHANKQSPLNLVDTKAECLEYHEIRAKPGDFLLTDWEVKLEILPNKLRINWPRRIKDRTEPDTPSADIPKGWGSQIDAIHTDAIVPAEHTIEGKRFDGEWRVYHVHPGGKGAAIITVLIEAGHEKNRYFQKALDAWQDLSDYHRYQCLFFRNRRLQGGNSTQSESFQQFQQRRMQRTQDIDESITPLFNHGDATDPLTSKGRFDPYHKDLMPSIWFYGYYGSLTEPPCYPIASWRVLDTPMLISDVQLEQMKKLLFQHNDPECAPTSVHFNESAARPIEKNINRDIHKCTCTNFLSDRERAATGKYVCDKE